MNSQTSAISGFSFTLSTARSSSQFGARLGAITLKRPAGQNIQINSPGLITSTSRGVVPHLSRDHHKLTKAISWVHVPFESFLEHNPPVPTLQPGEHPLHNFLGFSESQHVISMSIRDPSDGREMPANSGSFIRANTLRGVQRVTVENWRSHIQKCRPDFVVALSDIPFTQPPHSQKRLTKSITRSAEWLADILRADLQREQDIQRPNIFVHMAGDISLPARSAFADSITETLFGKEADMIKPLKCLNEGLSGYVFDLVPLHLSLEAARAKDRGSSEIDVSSRPRSLSDATAADEIVPLFKASLSPLSDDKLRLVNSARSPHEILRLIQHVGIDLFDAHWAQKAANIGIALDFAFPALVGKGARKRQNGKRDLGHNLYDIVYAHDFKQFAGCFSGVSAPETRVEVCPCAACSPISPPTRIRHGILDEEVGPEAGTLRPSFTRAYLHHLLHTHEMSAHTLLVMHNLSVLDAFFVGVRSVIGQGETGDFAKEVERFVEEYDEDLVVFDEANATWNEVDLARGKGSLAREKKKQDELADLAAALEV